MRVKTIRPATEQAAFLDERLLLFTRRCSPTLQTEQDVREMGERFGAYESARTLLAVEDQAVLGWISVIPWDGGYATLHPLSGAKAGWPTIRAGEDEARVGELLLKEAARSVAGEAGTLLMCIDQEVEMADEDMDVLRKRYLSLGYHYTHLEHYIAYLDGSGDSPSSLPGVRIELMRSADRNALSACILDAFSGLAARFFFGDSSDERDRYVAGLLDSPTAQESASAVAIIDDVIVGFASAIGDGTNLLIDWLGIRPEWHRQGLGSLLLRHAMEAGRAAGYATASGSANVDNEASIQLMNSLGWEREGGERQFVLIL